MPAVTNNRSLPHAVRVLALLAAAIGVTAQPGSACLGQYRSLPFCDPKQPTAARLDDLVKRVADADTAGQLTARAVRALPNIGVPGYYWGTNCIHGVQQVPCLPNGRCPTSFPAPNSLGATWNMSLVRDMGSIIGKELRAYFNTGKYNMGLDSWSPTINLNRDPRWGRNVEVAGEDPMLLGRYGVAYTLGLQDGTDPKALQAVVTLKHWVAYSVESYPGPNHTTVTRHNFNAIVSAQDLAESYYPAWEMTVKQSNPKGIMCSYNMLNGAPTCGNAALTAVLRNDWSFSGYITSDSDSVADIWQTHHYMPDCGSATGLALLSGTDIDSGNTYINCLPAILANKSIPRTVVDKALRNTYARRFELGLFDPETPNRYRNVSIDEVGTAESHAVSLLGARQSLILLKNDRSTLPFPKGKQVAVLGPSASVALDLLGNYLGTLCPGGGEACVPSLCQGIQAHQGGTVQCSTGVNGSLNTAVALARAADHVVLVLSSWRNWGGEGGDRVTIALDDEQAALVHAVAGVGKPTAAVLLNGGVLGIDAVEGDLPAIIEAFQPGIHGAQAIAEALFGDYNPGGKLPVTYYPSSYIDETPFLNMSMTAGAGRTYKYYTGKPLYPFGFGLSYTTFDLQWDPSPPPAVVMRSADAPAAVYTVTVTNTGSRAGDEVVFAFFKPQNVSLRQQQLPAKQLFDFQRVHLEPGQKAKLTFSLTAQDVKLADADGHLVIPTGQFTVHITRGHGTSIEAPLLLDLPAPVMVRRFRKWW